MSKIKETELRFYRESDWEGVRSFLHSNWRENHPICRKELFDWQHKGFGYEAGEANPLVLLHADEVVGFRGAIPGLYQVPLKNGEMEIVKGGSGPMWMVREDFRGIPSFRMYTKTIQMFPVMTAAGIKLETSMKFHRRHGFVVLDAMRRYIIPIDARGFQELLSISVSIDEIKARFKNLSRNRETVVEPVDPNIEKIAALWERTTFPQQIFSLYRNAEFWKWRYLDSCGFEYLFFGDPEYNGTIVARVEEIIATDSKTLNGKKVFRIIEILPPSDRIQNEDSGRKLSELIRGILGWAANQGCSMADFQCSSTRFGWLLNDIGSIEQSQSINEPICSIPSLFQPLGRNFRPINMAYRIDLPDDRIVDFNWEDTYMIKSESDQDRPNL